ncbi:hypothetical protein CLU85_1543 [Acidovorax sp. 69]|nr:hypothetical protein CLU85_1543 [Acidovorax sp. 69]
MTRLTRLPPAVQYPLRRSFVLGAVLLGLLLAGAGVLVAWFLGGARYPSGIGIAAGCLWLVVAACVLHFWWHQLEGVLRWDGQAWTVEDDQHGKIFWALSRPPEVILDLQGHLWVCAFPLGHHQTWLWLERSSQPERWVDMRRAVYSRAKPGADNADETAPAKRRGA